jgi:ATP-binding cassette subfamily B protein
MHVRDQFSSLNAFVQENISGNRVVRAFAKEDYEIGRFDKENAAYRDSELDAATIWTKYIPIFEFLSSLLTVILMVVGGVMCIRGDMTLGNLVMINSYLWMLNNPLRMIGWLINDYQRFATSVVKIYKTICDRPDIMTPQYPKTVKRLRWQCGISRMSPIVRMMSRFWIMSVSKCTGRADHRHHRGDRFRQDDGHEPSVQIL